ncbi:hypothetical protein OKW49_008265 [Paraburkholderia youngii]
MFNALIKLAGKLPQELYKSLTWDRGTEMADHRRRDEFQAAMLVLVVVPTLTSRIRCRSVSLSLLLGAGRDAVLRPSARTASTNSMLSAAMRLEMFSSQQRIGSARAGPAS